MIYSKHNRGFTLIEILIVVAIIGLLASIVTVGVTDAQEGARNNQRNELARQYIIALDLYNSQYGNYPQGGCVDEDSCAPNVEYVCLGDGYPADSCYVLWDHSESSTVNSQLSEFAPSIPASLEQAVTPEYTFQGISYGCLEYPSCEGYQINWFVEGTGSDAKCAGGATKTSLTGESAEVSICSYIGGTAN